MFPPPCKFAFQGFVYDFYGNMKLFDQSDRDAIEGGLKRVFDYDPSKINMAIASQVLCYSMYFMQDHISIYI